MREKLSFCYLCPLVNPYQCGLAEKELNFTKFVIIGSFTSEVGLDIWRSLTLQVSKAAGRENLIHKPTINVEFCALLGMLRMPIRHIRGVCVHTGSRLHTLAGLHRGVKEVESLWGACCGK